MKRQAVKTRKTLARTIDGAPDTDTAMEIARYGRVRTNIEKHVDLFLWLFDRYKTPNLNLLGGTPDERKAIAESVADQAETLSDLLIHAIINRDVKSIRIAADAVEAFGRRKSEADPLRAGVLMLKSILDKKGETMTIQRLAGLLSRNLVGDEPAPPKTDDGHATLRRLCRKLNFPIAPDARGRKLKTTNPKSRFSKS